MRQLGDLLVWFVMVGVLIVVVYFTPKFAQYMSSENQPTLSNYPKTGCNPRRIQYLRAFSDSY